jgi:hypothetical protein
MSQGEKLMAIDKEALRQKLAQTVQELMTPIDVEALSTARHNWVSNIRLPWHGLLP